MSNVDATNQTLKHLDRLKPLVSVDAGGTIKWTPSLVDYNKAVFHRGKTVTNDEFNELFTKQAYQGNYISDSLALILKEYLPTAMYRNFTSSFNLLPSYIKLFTATEWGETDEEGLYRLIIPASEHGFTPNEGTELAAMNVDVEMYLLDTNGNFFEVQQFSVTADNTVTAYTDDATLSGILIIKNSDKAYSLATEIIDASRINGLQDVALTGRYSDLIDLDIEGGPNTRLNNLENTLSMIRAGDIATGVAVNSTNATNAVYATNLLGSGTIQNIKVSDIFETSSNRVKNATNVTTSLNGKLLTNIFESNGTTVKEATHATSTDEAIHALDANEATHAVRADAATSATRATNANYADKAGTVSDVYYQKLTLGADIYFNMTAEPGDSAVKQFANQTFTGHGIWVGEYWFGNIYTYGLYKSGASNIYDVNSCTLKDLHSFSGSKLELISTGVAARTTPGQHDQWDCTALLVPIVRNKNGNSAITYSNGNSTIVYVVEDPNKDWRIDWGGTAASQITISNVIFRLRG